MVRVYFFFVIFKCVWQVYVLQTRLSYALRKCPEIKRDASSFEYSATVGAGGYVNDYANVNN